MISQKNNQLAVLLGKELFKTVVKTIEYSCIVAALINSRYKLNIVNHTSAFTLLSICVFLEWVRRQSVFTV